MHVGRGQSAASLTRKSEVVHFFLFFFLIVMCVLSLGFFIGKSSESECLNLFLWDCFSFIYEYIRNGDTKIREMKMKFRLGMGMVHSQLDSWLKVIYWRKSFDILFSFWKVLTGSFEFVSLYVCICSPRDKLDQD